jgi:DNA-binding NtrC family response regulator
MAHILIVSNDRDGLGPMLGILNDAGYQASAASTFEQAREELAGAPPDLVIADERLGAFNGLHVLLAARASRPGIGAIITTPVPNRALEADARLLNVDCFVRPQHAVDWLGPVTRALAADRC